MRLLDLTGRTFGRLTVLSRAENSKGGKPRWLCRCQCGNECIVHSSSLVSGNTKSCGCLRNEKSRSRAMTHGMSKSPLFAVWCAMIGRCENQNNKSYPNYGGRGISVCKEWHDSSTFFEWALNNGYSHGLTIERIDVDKGYEPDNCKWVSRKQQARNKTNNVMIEIDGTSKCLPEWCEEYGVNYYTVYQRIKKLGWEPKKALTTPLKKPNKKAGENHS